MYKVYFTNEQGEARSYTELTLVSALETAKGLRNQTRYSFITIASQNPDSVGKPGVDEIQNGVLPDGHTYDWKKRRI